MNIKTSVFYVTYKPATKEQHIVCSAGTFLVGDIVTLITQLETLKDQYQGTLEKGVGIDFAYLAYKFPEPVTLEFYGFIDNYVCSEIRGLS